MLVKVDRATITNLLLFLESILAARLSSSSQTLFNLMLRLMEQGSEAAVPLFFQLL